MFGVIIHERVPIPSTDPINENVPIPIVITENFRIILLSKQRWCHAKNVDQHNRSEDEKANHPRNTWGEIKSDAEGTGFANSDDQPPDRPIAENVDFNRPWRRTNRAKTVAVSRLWSRKRGRKAETVEGKILRGGA